MATKEKIQGALFDLDGVLIDSETVYTEFWTRIGHEYGIPSPTFAYDIKGTTLTDILNRYFSDEKIRAEVVGLIHEFENIMVYRVFEGVEEFLDLLRSRGWKMAIVTSSDDTKMKYLFSQQPWMRERFDAIVTGSMVVKSKPDPEGYNLAAKLIGCNPVDCVVFEDSFQGLEAGRRAGGRVVALCTTNQRESLTPLADVVIDSFVGIDPDTLLN